MSETTAGQTDFRDGPLYKALVKYLPAYNRDPFGAEPVLNVLRLKDAISMSHETVYKWLRSSKLSPEHAKILIALANSEENLKVLAHFERQPPTTQDFHGFVFS